MGPSLECILVRNEGGTEYHTSYHDSYQALFDIEDGLQPYPDAVILIPGRGSMLTQEHLTPEEWFQWVHAQVD